MRTPNTGRAFKRPKPPDDGVDIRINDDVTPKRMDVRTVNNNEVCPAYYPHGSQAHSHHLQSADEDYEYALWGWNEQARLLGQEDRNGDDTIGRGKNNGR